MPYTVTPKTEKIFKVVLEPNGEFPFEFEVDTTQIELHLSNRKLGWYINWLRTERKLSIRDVCKGSGLSTGHLSRIENAKNEGPPSMRILNEIAEFFEIGTDSLLLIAGIQPFEPDKASDNGAQSTGARFAELMMHECLQPKGIKRADMKWLAPEWKRAWVEFSQNLVHAIQAGEPLPEWLTEGPGRAS